jgi:predicted ATPase
MVKAIVNPAEAESRFYGVSDFGRFDLEGDYFRGLISVAYSAFDPFDLPAPNDDARYSYIGMTDYAEGDDGAIIKSKPQIVNEFVSALETCFADEMRKNRWLTTINTLQSDDNFAEMDLPALAESSADDRGGRASRLFRKMSSGHSVVILTMTQLVAKLEERTLVLIDEPESHLHPPLLSAMIRSLSQLLHSRNAVAIIATHSPVVLQEIPRSCVWKVFRSKLASEKKRPDTETFGENVGTLTREAFGLEVERSGFHTVLSEFVAQGGSYDEILAKLGGSLGNEAKGILRALVVNRDEN